MENMMMDEDGFVVFLAWKSINGRNQGSCTGRSYLGDEMNGKQRMNGGEEDDERRQNSLHLDIGRLFSGFGIRCISYVVQVPVFIAEIAPKNLRGGLTTLNQGKFKGCYLFVMDQF